MEASSFMEGTEQSVMQSSISQPAEEKDDEDRKRFLLVCCALLLLLLLLGLYFGWPVKQHEPHCTPLRLEQVTPRVAEKEKEEDEDGHGKTQEAQYKSSGGNGGKPPTTKPSTETTIGESTENGHQEKTTRAQTTASAAKLTTGATTTRKTTTTTTTKATTTTTTRTPSTGTGFLVCTVGIGGHETAVYPVKQELCDFIVFTHVFARNGSIISLTGRLSYQKFIEVATLYRADRHTRFGLSHSPRMLVAQLEKGKDPGKASSQFLNTLRTLPGNLTLPALGVMGLAMTVRDFTKAPMITTWYKALSNFVKNLPNGTPFLGLKLKWENPYTDSVAESRAKEVLGTVKDLQVTLLVLVTHNIQPMGHKFDMCNSLPVSSWKAIPYKNSTKPELEAMFKLLKFFLAAEKSIEVALSSTLVFMSYNMSYTVTKPVHFGGKCLGIHLQPFYAYCHKPAPNEHEHADSMTAVSFDGTMLSSFETPATVEKKMRQFVIPLDDNVFRRVGWAFFDLGFEVFNKSHCVVKNTFTKDFPRLVVAKEILDENRNRKFNQ